MIRESTVEGLRRAVHDARAAGRRVGFVPTMGALHDGHLALVRAARAESDVVVMSVFVNPTQFGPAEDFARYPRDLDRDASLASDAGVDILFAPSVEEMYPGGTGVRVEADDVTTRWEGDIRPGHFGGVLTVVAKLFNIVAPDVAVFGRKDFQQATLIRRMARQLHQPVRLVVAPTVREPDGLAMSSRNVYLSAAERGRALCLVASLRATASAFAAGERDGAALAAIGRGVIERAGEVTLDYFSVVDPDRMLPVERATAADVAIVAARVGRTRLIDNAILGEGP
jgi:pantoate--beta-alanine ligase